MAINAAGRPFRSLDRHVRASRLLRPGTEAHAFEQPGGSLLVVKLPTGNFSLRLLPGQTRMLSLLP